MSMAFAVGIAVVAVDASGGEHLNPYETSFGVHTVLGLSALAMAGFQARKPPASSFQTVPVVPHLEDPHICLEKVLCGLLRPHKPGKDEPQSLLRRLFEVPPRPHSFSPLAY